MVHLLQRLPFYHRTWFQFAVFVIKRFEANKCRQIAGALTYTTLFAVVPMLTVFLVIVSSIKALAPAREQMEQFIYNNLLPRSGMAVDQYLNTFAEKSSNLTVIGVLALFLTTVLMLSNIEEAFNQIWKVKKARGGIVGFMRYWTIISLSPILLGSAFALSSTVVSMHFLNNNIAGYELNGAFWLWLVSAALTWLGFSVLYWTIPNHNVPMRSAFIAGSISAMLFEGLRQLFGMIMTDFTSYALVYGAFAAVPIFLFWIFLSWNIILIGVEISYALTAFQGERSISHHPVLALLDILNLFYQRQTLGHDVSDQEGLQILGLGEVERWSEYTDLLVQNDLIRRTDNDRLVLCRNLSQISFWELYQTMPYPLPKKDELTSALQNYHWMQVIGPILQQTDEMLESKLNIPLSNLFDPNEHLGP